MHPTYQQINRSYIISSSRISLNAVVRDEQPAQSDFDETDLWFYFGNAHHTFIEHVMRLRSMTHPLSDEDEKELRFMLDAIIQAKRLLDTSIRSKK